MSEPGLNFQLLFEESPDVLLVLRPDSPRFTAVAATKARLNWTRSSLEHVLGRGVFEMFPDNPDDPLVTDSVALRASLERVLATKAPDTMAVQKYALPLPGGGFEAKYWSPRNIPILSPAGEVMYILHRAVDVTELARAGEEGEEMRRRTAEMEREVVRHGLETEAANRELDAFGYSVAHDLRGPLRSVEGFSQMLLQEDAAGLNEEGRRRLEVVCSSAQRMSQLIEDLLRLSQISRREVRRIPFELSAIVRTVALQILQNKPTCVPSLSIEEGVEVNADPHLLQIVLEHLLGNARKFTSKREHATIEFGSERVGGEVCYYVRDNGAGFDMKYAGKLFGPFQRLHSEGEFQGTGIGLAIVKRIVNRHGGRVWAEGEVDRGATVFFTLGESDTLG